MRILLSTIGSRGDVQPLAALALELRGQGHDAPIVAPPNFREWIESFGLTCIPVGPDVRTFKMPVPTAAPSRTGAPAKPEKLPKEVLQQLAVGTVREQFRVLTEAARGCGAIVGATMLQIAARSVAESLRIPYLFAAYAPVAIPSPAHPPARMQAHYPMWLPGLVNRLLWKTDARSFDARFLGTLNEERAKLGLARVSRVQRHVLTDRPLLAADPELAPMSSRRGMHVEQTGAWILEQPAPLPDDLERFLAAGEAPIVFGFGSMRGSEDAGAMLIETARALGQRAIVSRGWANLDAMAGDDCIAIGDVDYAKLFPRVAAIVHHGGAGTTTAAARAGKPQLVVPHQYDQFYWSYRMRALGVGVSGPVRDKLTRQSLESGLRECLQPARRERARALSTRLRSDGAAQAVRFITRVCADAP